MMQKISILALFLCPLSSSLPSEALAEAPTQTLRRIHGQINRLLKKKVKEGSTEEKRVKGEIKAVVNTLLDFKELAKLSLGKHWTQRSEKEHEEFVGILRDLIERNYVKQLRTNLEYKLEYREEQRGKEEDTVLVRTAIKVKKNNRITEILVDYKMRRTNGGWMVYDVITDEVSLVRNYRSQFNRIIRKDSYEELVKRMRRKLEETT